MDVHSRPWAAPQDAPVDPTRLSTALELLLRATPDTAAAWTADGALVFANDEARRRLGGAPPLLAHLLAPGSLAFLAERLPFHALGAAPWRGRLEVADGRGGTTIVHATIVVTLGPDGDVATTAMLARDAVLAAPPDQGLDGWPGLDALTGLMSRGGLVERLGDRADGSLALVVLEVEGLTSLNERLGQDTGDAILSLVAERLRRSVRAGDVVARIGGDEFAVLLRTSSDDDADTLALAERLRDVVQRPGSVDGREVALTVTAGAVVHANDRDPLDLLRAATLAVAQAREVGRGAACYDPARHQESDRRRTMAEALRGAIERDELWLAWQPQYTLADQRIVGVEALLRWDSPTLGSVPPATFIPVAETSDVIVPLGRWVLEQACRQARAWEAAVPGSADMDVHVNLSPRQFADPTIVGQVTDVLAATGLAPHRLCLEITETAVMDDVDAAVEALARLRAVGVKVAIDDFGVGYSSLSYLRRLPVDVLKLDRAFVERLDDGDAADAAIVVAVVNLARSLGLTVVAEGVETAAQRRELRALGCTMAQGYLFARPVPAPALTELLQREAWR